MDDRFEQCLGMSLRDGVDDFVRPGHQRYANARLGEIDHRQSDDESGRGNDFEVDERLQTHSSDLFQAARAGDTDDDGRENERRDDRLDQVEENVAQEVDSVSPIGAPPADKRSDDETEKNLRGERWSIPGTTRLFLAVFDNHSASD